MQAKTQPITGIVVLLPFVRGICGALSDLASSIVRHHVTKIIQIITEDFIFYSPPTASTQVIVFFMEKNIDKFVFSKGRS